MNKTKCLCGRTIPQAEHTGMCQLDHFISYTGDGKHGVDFKELRRIVDVIIQDKLNGISKLALAHLTQVEYDRKNHGEISEITHNELMDFVSDLGNLFKSIKEKAAPKELVESLDTSDNTEKLQSGKSD